MVEQAAARPLAQSGFNAFSFLSGMLRLIGRSAVDDNEASFFRLRACSVLTEDLHKLSFSQSFCALL